MAAIRSAVGIDVAVATWPQAAEPADMQPKNTIKAMARPRARTQLGSADCAETLRLVSTVIQPSPPSTAAGSAMAALVARPSSAIAAAVMSVPAATRRLASIRLRMVGSATAPVTAPPPIAASSTP